MPTDVRSPEQTARGAALAGLICLAAAAACRARSDWLIGMNATRALTKRLKSRKEKALDRQKAAYAAIIANKRSEFVLTMFFLHGASWGVAFESQYFQSHDKSALAEKRNY